MEMYYNFPDALSRFHTGGFVIHGITSPGHKGRVSAWYTPDGTLSDAEQRPNLGAHRTIPVKKNGPIWQRLEIIGKRHTLGKK